MKKLVFVLAFFIINLNSCIAQDNITENVVDTAVLNNLGMDKKAVALSDEQIQSEKEKNFDSIQNLEVLEDGRMISDTAWNKLIADEKLSYQEKKVKKKVPPKENPIHNWKPNLQSSIVILFVMIALVIVIIMYTFFGKQYFRKPIEKLSEDNANFEDVETFNEWEKSIQQAVTNQDYRLAVRILYLQTIQILNDKNRIIYKKELPSSAYLSKLYSTNLYNSFSELTRYFDYTWYGKYLLSAPTYQQIFHQFQTFQNSII